MWECRVTPVDLWWLHSCATITLCARGCGCSGHPAFPTPSVFLGERFMHDSGASRRGNADYCLKQFGVRWLHPSRRAQKRAPQDEAGYIFTRSFARDDNVGRNGFNFRTAEWIWLRALAARCARVVQESFALGKQRAQGMPGARCTRSLVRKV